MKSKYNAQGFHMALTKGTQLCRKPTDNGLPCALPKGHKGEHLRAAQLELRK